MVQGPTKPQGDLQGFVVFDMDGTLVDTSRDIADSVNRALAEFGLGPLEDHVILSFVGDGSRKLVDRCVSAAGGPKERSGRVAERFLEIYSEHLLDWTAPYPGIPEALRRLGILAQAVPKAIYSNKNSDLVQRVCDAMGWCETFRVVLGGDWGGPRKPAPDGLLEIATRLGIQPEKGVMVGDGLTDVLAGKAAGLATVAVCWGFRGREDLLTADPDAVCEKPEELPDILWGLLSR